MTCICIAFMLYYGVHFVQIVFPYLIWHVFFEINRLLPLEINIKLYEMPFLTIPELL